MLLDIGLPGGSGFDVVKDLPSPPPVVVITGDASHALEGFERGVVDLLVKPMSFERFLLAMNRVRTHRQPVASRQVVRPQMLMDAEAKEAIMLRSGRRMVRMPLERILVVRSSGDLVKLQLIDTELVVMATMKEIERMLHDKGFLRVHRTCIIAERILREVGRNELYTTVGELPLGAAYRANVRLRFQVLQHTMGPGPVGDPGAGPGGGGA